MDFNYKLACTQESYRAGMKSQKNGLSPKKYGIAIQGKRKKKKCKR